MDHDPTALDDAQTSARGAGESGQIRQRILAGDRAVAAGHGSGQDGVALDTVEPGEHAQEVDGRSGDAQAGLGRLKGDVEAHLHRGLIRHGDHRMPDCRMGSHNDAAGHVERVEDELRGRTGVEPVGGQSGAARSG